MKKIAFLFLISLIWVNNVTIAQNTNATIGTITSCNNTEVLVPLNIENFINVSAMTLFIGYDTTQLKFQSLENIHPTFQGIIFNAMTVPPQIGISFTNISGVTLLAGKLFDMKFIFKENNTALVFNPGCELVNSTFGNIQVTYVNGGVNPLIKITNQPQNMTVYQPQQANFSITSTGGTNFLWQRSSNGGLDFLNLENSAVYQGVNTENLTILSTSTLLSGSIFRCKISNGTCIKYSNNAMLTVLVYFNQSISLSQGWGSLSSYLNPANTNLDILFASLGTSLQIVLSGDKMYYPSGNINTIGSFDPEKGYAIKLLKAETLIISGSPVQNSNLAIPAGWSYLPVISSCDVTISTFFNPVISQIDMIQELPGVKLYWPEKSIFTLQTLLPGKSYKIKMKTAVTVTFPECSK